jgi:hypothetical protein
MATRWELSRVGVRVGAAIDTFGITTALSPVAHRGASHQLAGRLSASTTGWLLHLLSIDDLEASDPLRIVLNLHVRTVRETGTGGGTHIFAST